MSQRGKARQILQLDEIRRAFERPPWNKYGPMISPEEMAEITGRSRSTIYLWIEAGRLNGAVRRRGKGILIWRDKAIGLLFNGPEWRSHGENQHG